MIELRHVCKRFGSRAAVEDFSLRVGPGEIQGLLGHNGAGKSTAIGMMLGQVWPTAGEVWICGHDVTRHRSRALREVGAIFETPVFYDYLSGWRNLEILSHYTGPTPAARIREVLDWVGLTGRERAPVRTYSHGMRARLAIAQALLPKPRLLILDEPSDGLDPEGIHEIRETIRRLHRELGLTLLLSSHLLNEVEQLCTRICILNRGRQVFEGSLAETRLAPRWVRLRVDAWPRAEGLLRGEGLIEAAREGGLIRPAPGVGTDAIVQRLVEQGVAVFALAPLEQTLETFYLDRVKPDRGSAEGAEPSGPPTPG